MSAGTLSLISGGDHLLLIETNFPLQDLDHLQNELIQGEATGRNEEAGDGRGAGGWQYDR